MEKQAISWPRLAIYGALAGLGGAALERLISPRLAAQQQKTLGGKATALFRLPKAIHMATAPSYKYPGIM